MANSIECLFNMQDLYARYFHIGKDHTLAKVHRHHCNISASCPFIGMSAEISRTMLIYAFQAVLQDEREFLREGQKTLRAFMRSKSYWVTDLVVMVWRYANPPSNDLCVWCYGGNKYIIWIVQRKTLLLWYYGDTCKQIGKGELEIKQTSEE